LSTFNKLANFSTGLPTFHHEHLTVIVETLFCIGGRVSKGAPEADCWNGR